MNCRKPETAAAVLRCLPQQLEPEAARKLLLTAAVRRHADVALQALQLQSLQQHIDTAAAEAMLLHLLSHGECVVALCKLPAAAQLSSTAVAGLLKAAVLAPGGTAEAVFQLCSL